MTGPADAALLAAVAFGCVRGSAALGSARWPRRSPGAAILLWQALGLGGGLAAVGALIEIGVPAGSDSVSAGIVRVARVSAHGNLFLPGHPVLPVLLRLGSLILGLALLAQLVGVLIVSTTAGVRPRPRTACRGCARRSWSAWAPWTCCARPSWPRCWPTSGRTCVSGTTWWCCRSPRCGGRSAGRGPAPRPTSRWPC